MPGVVSGQEVMDRRSKCSTLAGTKVEAGGRSVAGRIVEAGGDASHFFTFTRILGTMGTSTRPSYVFSKA